MLVLELILVIVLLALFVYNINADFYCRILDKESNNDLKINAPIIYNDVTSNNALTIDCKGMQDNIIKCNKINSNDGNDDVYQLKCDATTGLLQLNCTSENNPINPNDKSNIKCNPDSSYYHYYNPSYTSIRRKLQENSDSDSLLLHVWSWTNMQIHINDKLVFEGSGNTHDQPWNLLKFNPLVDTFSITLDRHCPWNSCSPGGFVAWLNGQAIDWSHFKCLPQKTLKNWNWFPFNKISTYDDSDWPQAVDRGEWANFRKHATWAQYDYTGYDSGMSTHCIYHTELTCPYGSELSKREQCVCTSGFRSTTFNSSLAPCEKIPNAISVNGICDNRLWLYVNGISVEGPWPNGGYRDSIPTLFDPATDSLTFIGGDSSGYWCKIYLNDIEISLSHFRCVSQGPPSDWQEPNFDDSSWPSAVRNSLGFWSAQGGGRIWCRYHREVTNSCDETSQQYNGECWCSPGYKSDTGKTPCYPCDSNSHSTGIGSTACICNLNYYSVNGKDSPQECQACPAYTYSDADTAGKDASVCSCGTQYHRDWYVRGDNFNYLESGSWPIMTRSQTGFWPCEVCPENSAPGYNDEWGIYVPYRNTQPCRVKPAFKQLPIYNLTVCMEGSTTHECISRKAPVLSSKAAYFSCSLNSGTRHMQWDWHYVRDLIGWDQCYCYPGYVSIDGTDNKSPCTQCPEGSYTSRSGMTVCDVCGFGYYSFSGKYSFTATDINDCQSCPVGSTTTRLGSSSIEQCICDNDYYSPSGKAPCSKCMEGTWTNKQKQQTTCSVKQTASPSVSPAPTLLQLSLSPVAFNPTQTPSRRPVASRKPTLYPTRNPTTLSDCETGTFSETGKEPCQSCPSNSRNYFSGQKDCICDAGFFSQDGNSPCYGCPTGTISDVGSTYCTACVGFSPCTASFNASNPPLQALSVPTVYPTQQKPTTYPTQRKPNLRQGETNTPRKRYVYRSHSPTRSSADTN